MKSKEETIGDFGRMHKPGGDFRAGDVSDQEKHQYETDRLFLMTLLEIRDAVRALSDR